MRAHGTDVAYNWGLFSFRQPRFLRRFLTGDTRYWMGGEDANAMVDFYRRLGRPITLQRLESHAGAEAALRDFLRWNALEENKYYRYDYFLDNCSTRLRDALDRALGGALRAATDSIRTPLSYRRESVRLTDGDRPIQTGIDIALGRPADAPLTMWESFFIPMRLRDALRGAHGAESARTAPACRSSRRSARSSRYPGTPRVAELPTAPRLVWRLLARRTRARRDRGGHPRHGDESARRGVGARARRRGVVAAVRRDRGHPRARVDGDATHLLGVERESVPRSRRSRCAGGAVAAGAAARARARARARGVAVVVLLSAVGLLLALHAGRTGEPRDRRAVPAGASRARVGGAPAGSVAAPRGAGRR